MTRFGYRLLTSTLAGLGLCLPVAASAQTAPSPTPVPASGGLPSTNAKAVPTFESIGLYWTPPTNPGAAGCSVRYQKVGDVAWQDGLPMWYDARNKECRGSLVQLSPATSYVAQLSLPGQAPVAQVGTTTWNPAFPIARTVNVTSSAQTLAITQGGTASGYVLYTFAPGTAATIDVANNAPYDVTISVPYVIVRGLTLKGAQQDAIRLLNGAHDVVIEDNDISGWGRFRTSSAEGDLGMDGDSAIHAACTDMTLERIIVQRNSIHDPRYTTNSWSISHPYGPQGVNFEYCGGNHVFRFNEIYGGTSGNYYNDGIGGADNFTTTGFPNYDTDIYGNIIKNTWDDAIEAEGGDRNVRIWGNYFDQTTTGVATTVAAIGPVYIFRNVYNRSRQLKGVSLDSDDRNVFAKSGSQDATIGGGRRYIFHNTLLQATQSGLSYPLGAGGGIGNAGTSITNTVSRNNIFHIWKTNWQVIFGPGSNNDFGYDLYNGSLGGAAETSGIYGTPIYQAGNGWTSEAGGMYQLSSSSPGFDKGVRLANFNDNFIGAAPDVGAHEAGTPAMLFGRKAGGAAAATPTPTPTPKAVPTPTPIPTPAPIPTPTAGSTPFTGTPYAVPGSFEAENFDKGGEGVAYHATTPGNQGGQYRLSEDVDIITTKDSLGGGYDVYAFQTGNWLNYTINVANSGNYSVQLRGSNNYSSSVAFHIEIDGIKVTSSLLFPKTGAWTTYQWIATPNIAITAGKHVLKIFSDQQYVLLNSVKVVAVSTTTPTPTPAPTPTPKSVPPPVPPPVPTPVPTPAPTASIPTAGVSWSCDFETDYCGFNEQSALGDAPPNTRRSSLVATARSGKQALRLHTEPGDNNVHGSGTWERDDISDSPSSAYCNQGQEEWWAYSVLFPTDYVFPPGPEAGVILDFHHNASSGQSNFEVQTVPGVGIRIEGHGGPVISGGRYDFVIPDPYGAPAGSVTKNVWYDFVHHVKWDASSNGLVETWLNGKKVMTYNGATLYTGIACYLKLANYHAGFGLGSSVIFDRIIRGTGAAAVAITPLSP